MATTPEGVEPVATGPERRVNPVQLALVLVGLLLVLLLVWFFVLRSDEDPEETAVAPAPVTEETPVEEDADAPPKGGPVETFEVFAPKDPFDPLISASAGGAGETSATTIGSGTATGTTSTTTGTTTTTTTTGSGGTGDGSEQIGGHRVRVVDVFVEGGNRRAQVQVDGTVYTVDEGDRFATNFQLLSTSGQCATMLFGDDEFTLCEGEEILK